MEADHKSHWECSVSNGETGKKNDTSIPDEAAQACKRKGYASFGDDGVTATVNAYGEIMQITRYFGEKSGNPSGFLCAEMSENGYSSPYYAWERLDDLNSASSKFDGGLNLQMDREDIKGLNLPQMSFVSNRWPHFKFAQSEKVSCIEYLVRQNTVYQIYRLNLSNIDMGSSESPPTITYNPTVRLRDLDFTKEGDGFHEIKPDQEQPGQDQAAQEQSAQEQSAQEQSAQEQSAQEQSAQEQSAQENTIQNRTHMETSDQMESEFSDSDDAESDDSGLDDGYDHRNGLNAGLKEKPLSKDSHQDPQVPENKDASSWVWRYDGSKPAGFENNVGLFISPFSGDVPHQSSTGV